MLKFRKSTTIILVFSISVILMSSMWQNVFTQESVPSEMRVGYIGREHENWQDQPVDAALSLDSVFKMEYFRTNESITADALNKLDVIVLQDFVLDAARTTLLKNWVAEGNGLIIFSGPNLSNSPQLFVDLSIIESTESDQILPGYTNALPEVLNESHQVTSGFDWNAVPDMNNYTIFPATGEILVQKQTREDSIRIENDPLIFIQKVGLGQALVFAAWVEDGYSLAFRGCAFFNYLIYSATITQAGMNPMKLSYANWEYSPVPHTREKGYFLVMIAAAATVGFVLVKRAKNNSKKALDASSFKIEKNKEDEDETNTESETGTDGEVKMSKSEKAQAWQNVGLHKQISGFFISLFTAILAAGPQIVLILFIFPVYIMPFPQAAGIYTITNDLFAAVWLVLDVGTSIALVTFFSYHRAERPEKAVHYIQIFIFWQLITGVIQFSIVAALSLFYFPNVINYAYLSYHILIHSLIQFPGFLSVMLLTLRALQRSDLEQISMLLVNFVFKIGVTYLCVLLFRALLKDSIMFGEIFGAIIGLNIGAWVGNFADFGFSYFLFKKAGYKGNMLFRWDFTKEEVIEVLKYGIRLVMGNVWVPAVATLQALLLTTYVQDYSSEMAYYQLALQIGGIIALVGMFCDSLQAPIAESYGFKQDHGKELYLSRVYTTSFKWVNFLNFFLTSSLFALGWRLIIGFSGPTWSRAAFFLIPIIIFQFLGPYSWIGDKFFLGCNMPSTLMVIWIIEQGVRAVGLLIFVPMYGMIGVMFAYIPGLLAKDLISIIYIRKKIVAPKFYWWQSWIAPAIAAVINFLLLETVCKLLWDGTVVTSIILFLIGVIVFMNIFAFIAGWLGAWDENEMKELYLAKNIAIKGMSMFLIMIYGSTRAGMKIKSPFVGKSRIDIWESAQVEMNELQALKKQLKL